MRCPLCPISECAAVATNSIVTLPFQLLFHLAFIKDCIRRPVHFLSTGRIFAHGSKRNPSKICKTKFYIYICPIVPNFCASQNLQWQGHTWVSSRNNPFQQKIKPKWFKLQWFKIFFTIWSVSFHCLQNSTPQEVKVNPPEQIFQGSGRSTHPQPCQATRTGHPLALDWSHVCNQGKIHNQNTNEGNMVALGSALAHI